MENTYNELELLSENKSVVFYSPIEGDVNLVRTGTIDFFNSIFYAIKPQYIFWNKDKKLKYIEDYEIQLLKQHPILVNENIRRFSNNFYYNMKDLYKYIEEKYNNPDDYYEPLITNKKDIKTYNNILQFIPLKSFSKILKISVEDFTDQFRNDKIKKYISLDKIMIKYITKYLKEKKQDDCEYYIEKLITYMFDLCCQKTNIKINTTLMEIIIQDTKHNIYIIDKNSRLPIINTTMESICDDNIIILKHNDVNYEIVGKLLDKNNIQRIFNNDDPLIDRIHTYLYRYEQLPKKYPDLLTYLNKNIRKTIGF